MNRKFLQISKEELQNKIQKFDGDYGLNIHKLLDYVSNDIKVSFDLENHGYDSDNNKDESVLLGFHTLENGLTFLGMCACGDWESPVFFIIYWDGRLRAYIPKEGNCWNITTKEAYGNDLEADFEDMKKRWPEKTKDLSLIHI
jgi:hypothetical protein